MKAFKESEKRLRIIADNTYHWEYWRTPEGGYAWISPAFEAITGYPLDPFMLEGTSRTRVRDIIHPEDRLIWENHIAEIEKSETGQKKIDLRIIKANGETIWISHICKPIYGSGGEFLGRRGCNLDVTEHQKMVEELTSSQQHLMNLLGWKNNILNVSAFGMLVVTEQKIITEVNKGFVEMFGYSPDEVIGCSVDMLHVSNELSRDFGEQYWGVTAQKKVVAVEWQLKRKTGEIFWCSLTGSALDMQDLYKGVVWIIRDITERKQMELELRKSELRFRTLFEQSIDAIAIMDSFPPCFRYVNPAFVQLFGYSQEEIGALAEDRIWSIVYPEDLPVLQASLKKRIEGTETSARYEFRIVRKDGEVRWVETVGYCSQIGDKVINQSLYRDITERKRMEDALSFVAQRGWMAGGENFFDALVLFLSEKLDMEYVIIAETNENLDIAETVALCGRGAIMPNMRYALKGTPCENVMGRRLCVYPQGIQQLFSEDTLLAEMGAESYIGIPLWDSTGSPIGLIALINSKPLSNDEPATHMLQVVATRAAAELERKRNDHVLRMREHEFRTLAENLPDNIVRYDRAGRVVYVNPVLEKNLGDLTANMIGTRIRERHPDGSYEAYAQAVDHALASGDNGEFELRVPVPSKKPIVHQVRMIVERDGQGEVAGVLAIGRDITKEKELERERQVNLEFFVNMERINRAIQGADDPQIMMKDLLDVVLSIFDCDRAFLLYPCDPVAPTWAIKIESNKPEYPGLLAMNREMPMDPHVAETLRILLAADRPIAFGPGTPYALPEEVSQQFDFKCFMSMAIYPKIGKPWQFGVHQCAYTRTWTVEEVRLFNEIGRRLADSLSNLLSYRDLCKNEKFLDKVVEHIPNMIFVKEAQGLKFVRFNKAGEQLLGYPREDLLGKTDRDFFPKKEADFFMAWDRQVLTTGKLVDIPEESIRNSFHEERILHTKKIPILDEAGIPQFLLGISEDITDRKQAENSIRKLSQAIEQSPVSIVITDIKGRIEFVNAKFTQITGYSVTEALGQNPRILKSGETTAEEYERLWKTIATGGVWNGVFHNRKKNGELFWEHATIAPVRNEGGLITHYVAVKEDISELKKVTEQLYQAQKMESVGRLAGGVAHDFNNMLGVILGYSELIMKKVDNTQPIYSALQVIQQAALRSAELTKQLLAFARKQTITPKEIDLNAIVESMFKMLLRIIGEDIDLVWLPGKNLWLIKMDPSQIDQILVNLCVNARDAIENAGKITIETGNVILDATYCSGNTDFVPGEYVLLAVSDNGCGMSPEIVSHLFEPFFTTKEIGRGTGLGLSTVWGIIKQNKGSINVYSEPGRGTTFKIYLPRHKKQADKIETEDSAEPVSLGYETILLVEDEPMILDMTKMMLERLGYNVLAAGTPGEAIRLATEHAGKIHLVMTDVIMPKMNGRDLVKNLVSFYPDIKRLFMSGYTADVIAHQNVLDEGVLFIQKPFSLNELATKMREALNQ